MRFGAVSVRTAAEHARGFATLASVVRIADTVHAESIGVPLVHFGARRGLGEALSRFLACIQDADCDQEL